MMETNRRYSLEKKQEQISRVQLKAFLEPFEWITGDIEPDLGEDIFVRIYDQGSSTGLSFYIQLKSVSDIDEHKLKNGVISYPIEVSSLKHWENQIPPVFLVVWDITQSLGWWEYIPDATKKLDAINSGWREQKTIKLHIPLNNLLDLEGLSYIRRIIADLYFPVIAKDREFIVNAVFEFPHTPEGMAKLDEFQRHVDFGDSVKLEGCYIKKFVLPDWFERLYGGVSIDKATLNIDPIASQRVIIANVDFFHPDMEVERIPNIEFKIIKQGKIEVTLSNEHQNIPHKFLLILNGQTGENTMKFSINYGNIDAISARQAVRIQTIVANGGKIRFLIPDIGVSDVIQINQDLVPLPNDAVVQLIDNIYSIQQRMDEQIVFPLDGSYSQADIDLAKELVTATETGVVKKVGKTFCLKVGKNQLEEILNTQPASEPVRLRFSFPKGIAKMLGSEINLGPFVQYVIGIWRQPREYISVWLQNANEEDQFKIVLENCEIVVVFENWIKDGRKEIPN